VEFRIDQVPATATWPLRQAVLRPHQTVEEMGLPEDDDPLTAAFVAVDDHGEIVGTARVAPSDAPASIEGRAPTDSPVWRLRGMATRQDLRHQGIGGAVLNRTMAYVANHGGGLLWCSARVPAVNFYLRAGFTSHGQPWEEPDIGPHQLMWRTVAGVGA
jgi:GNAT superfamily N-acetyltransferase